MKSKTTGQLLLIASRILKSMYDSKVASLRDCIDAEENFLAAEYNHVGPRFHENDIMIHRAYDYIENGAGRKTKITCKFLKTCEDAIRANEDFENSLTNTKISHKKSAELSTKSIKTVSKLVKETSVLYPEFKKTDYISLLNMAEGITVGIEPEATK